MAVVAGVALMPSLFPEFEAEDAAPLAARLAPKLRALAEREVYFGTSSWKYEGWIGSIYSGPNYLTRGKFSQAKFDGNCLAEYARTFPTVCGDFAFYQFPAHTYWEKLFDQTPAGFLMGLKVPEDITVAVWPKYAKYGPRAGKPNEHFLDAKIFEKLFADRLRPHAGKLGPLIFEFGTFNKSTFPDALEFRHRLDGFLSALPTGFRYSVEIRNPEYLGPEYFEMLSSHNVAHVFNAWTRMPTLDEQAAMDGAFTADFAVVRALLKKGRGYEDAVKTFEPYERIQEPNEGARAGMVAIAGAARKLKIQSYFYVNNRLEGHAPGTIEAVADAI